MPSEPRLTLLTTGLGLGGAEDQVASLALRMHRRGWQVSVVSMLDYLAHAPALEECGIPVVRLRMRRGVPDPRAVFRLAAHVTRFRPAILHCHMVHANLLGRITRLLAPVPVLISTAHNTIEGGPWLEWAYRLTDRLTTLTTNVSPDSTARYAVRKLAPAARLCYMPNGIDTARFVPATGVRRAVRESLGWGDAFVWITVGNMRPSKDYPNLLHAFDALRRNHPRCRLAVAGSGPLAESVERLGAQLGLAETVQFLGRREDARDLLAGADGFVMASAWEGMPIALLEAAASGLPLVVTAVGGNPEVVIDGKTGRLVPPGDSAALTAAMAEIVQLPAEQRLALGGAARRLVAAQFDLDGVATRWESLYRDLLAGRPVPGTAPDAVWTGGAVCGKG